MKNSEEVIKILASIPYVDMEGTGYTIDDFHEALLIAIRALELVEVWNSPKGFLVQVKGTFEKIYNDGEVEKDEF